MEDNGRQATFSFWMRRHWFLTLLAAYENETGEAVWASMNGAVREVHSIIEGDEASEATLKAFAGKLARRQYDRLGWVASEGESEDDTNLRGTIMSLMFYSEDSDFQNKAHELYGAHALDTLDPELRSLIIANEVRNFDSDGTLVTQLLKQYTTTVDGDIKQDLCSGLTATRRPESIRELLGAIKDSSVIRPQDTFYWYAYLVRGKYSRTLAWQWLQDNWDWVEKSFAGDKTIDSFPRYTANALRTAEELTDYRDFFAPQKTNPALTRVITIVESEIEGRVAHIEHEKEAVIEALDDL